MLDSSQLKVCWRVAHRAIFIWIAFALVSVFPEDREHPGTAGTISRVLFPTLFIQDDFKNCCEPLNSKRFWDDWYAVRDSVPYKVIRHARSIALPTDRFLVFRYPDFLYYGRASLLRELDPVLADFYKATDATTAYAELRRLGITYVYVPSYEVASLSYSHISEILSNPALATLVSDEPSGIRLFKLATPTSKELPLVHRVAHWAVDRNLGPLDGWSLDGQSLLFDPSGGPASLTNDSRMPAYVCYGSLTCDGAWRVDAPFAERTTLHAGRRYRVTTVMEGEGLVRLAAMLYQPAPDKLQPIRVQLWATAARQTPVTESQVFFMPQSTRGFALIFSLPGRGNVRIREITLDEFDSGEQ